MKFLVILISLTANYLWLKNFDRFNDGWFFVLRDRVGAAIGRRHQARWMLPALFGLLLVPLALVLVLVDGLAFGLPTLIVHVLVLLAAMDRTQPDALVADFLRRWQRGDYEACSLYLRETLPGGSGGERETPATLARCFGTELVYRCFERMFMMFFWYVLFGPVAVLFCYVTYQLRDSQRQEDAQERHLGPGNGGRDSAPDSVAAHPAQERQLGPGNEARGWQLATAMTLALEWLPLRLLGITFSLVGNFELCLERLRETFWQSGAKQGNAPILHSYAMSALAGRAAVPPNQPAPAPAGLGGATAVGADDEFRAAKARELMALQSLLERSQAVWLAALAFVIVLGWSG